MQTCSADGSSTKWATYTDPYCSVPLGDEQDNGLTGVCHNNDERGLSTMTGCAAGVVTVSEYYSLDCAGEPTDVGGCHPICAWDGCHNRCDERYRPPHHEFGAASCGCLCVCASVTEPSVQPLS